MSALSALPVASTLAKRDCHELYLGNRGLVRLEGLNELGQLSTLYVNDNYLRDLRGLESNFRLRRLLASRNRITSLGDSSLVAYKYLEELDLSINSLSSLDRVLETLSFFPFLRRLWLHSNPCAEEPEYRARVAAAIPSLAELDDRPLLRRSTEVATVGRVRAGASATTTLSPIAPPAAHPMSSTRAGLAALCRSISARRASAEAAHEATTSAVPPLPTGRDVLSGTARLESALNSVVASNAPANVGVLESSIGFAKVALAQPRAPVASSSSAAGMPLSLSATPGRTAKAMATTATAVRALGELHRTAALTRQFSHASASSEVGRALGLWESHALSVLFNEHGSVAAGSGGGAFVTQAQADAALDAFTNTGLAPCLPEGFSLLGEYVSSLFASMLPSSSLLQSSREGESRGALPASELLLAMHSGSFLRTVAAAAPTTSTPAAGAAPGAPSAGGTLPSGTPAKAAPARAASTAVAAASSATAPEGAAAPAVTTVRREVATVPILRWRALTAAEAAERASRLSTSAAHALQQHATMEKHREGSTKAAGGGAVAFPAEKSRALLRLMGRAASLTSLASSLSPSNQGGVNAAALAPPPRPRSFVYHLSTTLHPAVAADLAGSRVAAADTAITAVSFPLHSAPRFPRPGHERDDDHRDITRALQQGQHYAEEHPGLLDALHSPSWERRRMLKRLHEPRTVVKVALHF